ncbi:MAG: DNA cytosine methyltransferase [Acidobacteria bacterium]|nr:DNA cytosine methyltransferase [Acidobacteriota bacterium]
MHTRVPRRLVGVDLFAGAGGMSLGFEQAGIDVAAAVEFDPIHCGVHEFNFPNCSVICKSVAEITASEIRSQSRIGDADVDVVFGGAPCQGFSMMGKRALDDPRNSLVKHFVRVVADLKARYFVFENVKGLTIGAHKRFLDEIMREFAGNGYNVVQEYRVLNAAEYGVPQVRHRLFLYGAKKGLPLPVYKAPTHSPAYRRGAAANIDLFRVKTPSVWDALNGLPEADQFEELLERDWVRTRFGASSEYASILRDPSTDPADYSTHRELDGTLLSSSMRTVHTELSKSRFKNTKHGETEPVSHFLKLDPAGLCNTLRAGTASDRGAFTSPRPIHPFSPRCITVREAARLHSYPDWFRFHVTKWHGFRQIGNSVPPLLARAAATPIVECLSVPVRKPDHVLPLSRPELLSMDMTAASKYYGVPFETIPQRNR